MSFPASPLDWRDTLPGYWDMEGAGPERVKETGCFCSESGISFFHYLRQPRMTMPTYKYFCDNCRHRFKRVESISAHEQHRKPACPKCRSKRVSRVFSGFYAKTGKKS